MPGAYSYDRLRTVHESQDQDITEAQEVSNDARSIFRPLDSPVALHPLFVSDHNVLDQFDETDSSSLKSPETSETKSSGINYSKIRNIGARLRRKPLPQYFGGSSQRQAATDIEPTRIGRGLWHDQLLSDRSLRGMAILMSILAIVMIIVVAVYADTFKNRANRNSSSVGGKPQSCKRVTHTNTALLLLINICATMVLGMSNTYQQLATSLKITDLKHALSKFGDSRVGTNSPFNIRHKKEGKKSAWAAWIFLVLTSLPIHFLANSLIGPSFAQGLPTTIDFDEQFASTNGTRGPYEYLLTNPGGRASYEDIVRISRLVTINSGSSFACWSAFRTGTPHYAKNSSIVDTSRLFSIEQYHFDASWGRMVVHFVSEKCLPFVKDLTDADLDMLEGSLGSNEKWPVTYIAGECRMGYEVMCSMHDRGVPNCRLNVRMSVAFTLMTCLILKAIYRECMVNATDNFRRHYSHTCHKHCFNPEKSNTGDEIGHCQKCKKWNSNNKFANLSQPAIATKLKKSLITNLGSTALMQMLIMMFCSIFMLGASITLAVNLGMEQEYMGGTLEEVSGGFGGFNRSRELVTLPPNKLTNEIIAISVSNGAQFIYSLLYLLLIYNITLISQERDWGAFEYGRHRVRTTLVSGPSFAQTYLLQLPKKILFPVMIYSVLTHWMLGEALQTQEAAWFENSPGRHIEHSKYMITYAAYPLWIATFLISAMTAACWWAFSFRREGFIPQMYGSVRVLMASTTQLDDFPEDGVQWGDLGEGTRFRHAGLSAEVGKIRPNELYAGKEEDK